MTRGPLVERRSQPAYYKLPDSGILVFESHHSATFTMPPGRWAAHKLVWVPVGRGTLESESGAVPLNRDVLLWVPAGELHRFVDDRLAPLTLVMAVFSEEVVQRCAALGDLLASLNHRSGTKASWSTLSSYRRGAVRDAFRRMLLEHSRGGPGSVAMLSAGLLDVLVHLLRAEPGKPTPPSRAESVKGTLEYVEDFFHTAIGVKDLADMCGLSTRRYSDLFKRCTGKTVVQYINERRIEFAKERLRESGQIAFAAVASGFTDVTHFYRSFKKMTGLTPGQYIEQSNSEGPV